MGNNNPGADLDSFTSSEKRRIYILETYLYMLSDASKGLYPRPNKVNLLETSFEIAESIRGSKVKQAINDWSTRIATGNEALTDLVRREQDSKKQIAALQSVLLNAFSQKTQNNQVISELQSNIDNLSSARESIISEISKRFPGYTSLTRPKPATIINIENHLLPDEALISIYVAKNRSYVWVISGNSSRSFNSIDISEKAVSEIINSLRKGLIPKSGDLGGLPDFDVKLSNQLYQIFLQPTEHGWKNATHLIFVTNGPFGYFPPGLFVTKETEIEKSNSLLLSEYRKVDWLIRDHSITIVPTSDVFSILRTTGSNTNRAISFAGFGDPVFSQQQLNKQITTSNKSHSLRGSPNGPGNEIVLKTRGVRIIENSTLDDRTLQSVTLQDLQPLPDTRDEILEIAATLNTSDNTDVFLGTEANESLLRKLDLSNKRYLVFATHGLIPGDLDGLMEPALALSSPLLLGDSQNDGLLTMGEIMSLRLNADWVVLSACNTAAADGSGAEAASGLGRAFFYAGTRAILLSNWPVETQSAKMLTTDLFRRQINNQNLSRSQALQKSMLNLIDNTVYRDEITNTPIFAYAHPIFWAPFTLFGDGGRQ